MDLQNGDLLLFGSTSPLVLDPDILQARGKNIDSGLLQECCGFEQPTDVLQRFALSRRQILEHCGDSQLNTDLNLHSEMHLASLSFERRRRRPIGEDPYHFLRSQARFDLEPFVSVDVDTLLCRLAEQSLIDGDRATARRILQRLEISAPALADSLDPLLAHPARVPVAPSTR
jgi:hypothetical protein